MEYRRFLLAAVFYDRNPTGSRGSFTVVSQGQRTIRRIYTRFIQKRRAVGAANQYTIMIDFSINSQEAWRNSDVQSHSESENGPA